VKRGFTAALVSFAMLSPAVSQAAADPLEGLWRYHAVTRPALRGPIEVTRQGGVWRASVGGHTAVGRVDGRSLRFAFPEGLGELRIYEGPAAPGAFWRQPPQGLRAGRDPAGASQPFASPLALRRVGADAWQGDVAPLANSFTLWLKVFRSDDGALMAAFRNPEANSNGGRSQFLVTRDGQKVRFATRAQPGRPTLAMDARLSSGRLTIDWPAAGGEIALTRPSPAQAAAFYPRPPEAPPYAYAPPPPLADGWSVARAAAVGLDEATVEKIVRDEAASDPASARPPLMHSILVARHGKLVLEEYFFGYDRSWPHDLRSASKTFASVMLGAAMRRDPGLGPESRIYDLLAAKGPFANPDPRKTSITLAHLMTHSAGLACDDNDDASPGNEERMQTQIGQPDWAKYTLDLPLAHDPGTRYAYCSANLNLVGAALAARARTWLPALFDEAVARPLRFGRWYWNLTPTGDGYAGGGAELTPRDFLKVGQAYLEGGQWRGRRIVEAAWVELSTAPHMAVTPQTTGLSEDAFQDAYVRAEDGYAWHLNTLRAGERTFRDFEATGNGGQLLIVVPSADLVVAITAGNYGQGGIWSRWRDTIVGQQILAHLR
jgi:CubicO group peptidase (beta-lactamase class C family)